MKHGACVDSYTYETYIHEPHIFRRFLFAMVVNLEYNVAANETWLFLLLDSKL